MAYVWTMSEICVEVVYFIAETSAGLAFRGVLPRNLADIIPRRATHKADTKLLSDGYNVTE